MRLVEVYEIDLPDHVDVAEVIDTDLTFDEHLVSTGEFQESRYEEIDYPELKLEVIDRQSAKIIQMRRRT